MGLWKKLFSAKNAPANPALKEVRRHLSKLTPRQSIALEKIPTLAATYLQGAGYIYDRVIRDLLREYDDRFGSGVLDRVDEAQTQKITEQVLHYMIFHAYSDLSARVDNPNLAGLLLAAVHFEIFSVLPSQMLSFLDFLRYENRNFEDPSYAPAYKFGQDIAAITGMADINLPVMLSQQSPLIAELTKKLTHLALGEDPPLSCASGDPL